MPTLIELARHMDRADRISDQIRATNGPEASASNSLTHLLAAEETRIRALSQQLKLPLNQIEP